MRSWITTSRRLSWSGMGGRERGIVGVGGGRLRGIGGVIELRGGCVCGVVSVWSLTRGAGSRMASMARRKDDAALREFLGEAALMLKVQADLIQRYVEIGDDVGLRYAVRRMTAYARAVIETTKDLGRDD